MNPLSLYARPLSLHARLLSGALLFLLPAVAHPGLARAQSPVESAPAEGVWTLDAPDLTIGREDDARYQFFRLQTARFLSDGRILVTQHGEPLIRAYSSGGVHLWSAGGVGGGPGEFDATGFSDVAILPGDSVATWEMFRNRIQIFGPTGEYVRAFRLALPATPTAETDVIEFVGIAGGAVFVYRAETLEGGAMGQPVRNPRVYMRFDLEGKFIGEVGAVPGGTLYMGERTFPGGDTTRGPLMQPMGPRPVSATVRGGLIYGGSDTPELSLFTTDGAVTSRFSLGLDERPVTSDVEDQYAAAYVSYGSPFQEMDEKTLRDAPIPRALPYFADEAFSDRGGRLWIEEYALPGTKQRRWFVIELSGRWVGELTLETGMRLVHASPTHVLLVVADELGVQRVQRRPIRRAAG